MFRAPVEREIGTASGTALRACAHPADFSSQLRRPRHLWVWAILEGAVLDQVRKSASNPRVIDMLGEFRDRLQVATTEAANPETPKP